MALAEKISPSLSKYLMLDGDGARLTRSIPERILYKTGLRHGKIGSDSDAISSILKEEFAMRKHVLRKEKKLAQTRIKEEILDLRARVEAVEIQLSPSNSPKKPEGVRPDLSKIEELSPFDPHSMENRSPGSSALNNDFEQAKEILFEWRLHEKKIKELLADQTLWDLNETKYNAFVSQQKELTIQLQDKKAALQKSEERLAAEHEKWDCISGAVAEIFQVLWAQYRAGFEDGRRIAEIKSNRKSHRRNNSTAQSPLRQNVPNAQLDITFEL